MCVNNLPKVVSCYCCLKVEKPRVEPLKQYSKFPTVRLQWPCNLLTTVPVVHYHVIQMHITVQFTSTNDQTTDILRLRLYASYALCRSISAYLIVCLYSTDQTTIPDSEES